MATRSFLINKNVTTQNSISASLQTLSGNSQTIEISGQVIRLDAGGSSRTGTILQKGHYSGQFIIVLNEGGETVDTATEATSHIAGAGGATGFQPGLSYMFVWDSVNNLWSSAGNLLS